MEASRVAHHPPELSADVSVIDVAPGAFAICRWREVRIVAWVRQADAEAVARLRVVSIASHAESPNGAISVHLVAPNTALPTAEARTGLIDIMQHYVGPNECVAVVLGAGGFWASALRSVVLGMRMVTPRFPMMFHSDTLSAARWLAKETKLRGFETFKPDEMARALNEVARFAHIVIDGSAEGAKV